MLDLNELRPYHRSKGKANWFIEDKNAIWIKKPFIPSERSFDENDDDKNDVSHDPHASQRSEYNCGDLVILNHK